MIANLILELCESQVRRGGEKKRGRRKSEGKKRTLQLKNYKSMRGKVGFELLLIVCPRCCSTGACSNQTFEKSASLKYSIFISDCFDVALRSILHSQSNSCLNCVTPYDKCETGWFIPTRKDSFILK